MSGNCFIPSPPRLKTLHLVEVIGGGVKAQENASIDNLCFGIYTIIFHGLHNQDTSLEVLNFATLKQT